MTIKASIEADKHAHAQEGFKGVLAKLLTNHWFEFFVVGLLFADIILVFTELGIEDQFICIGGRLVDVAPAAEGTTGDGHALIGERMQLKHAAASELLGGNVKATAARGKGIRRALSKAAAALDVGEVSRVAKPDDESHDEPNVEGSESSPGHSEQVLQCKAPTSHDVEHIVHIAHSLSVSILVFFAVENLVKLLVIPGFWDNFWHKVDIIVVLVSLLVDTAVSAYIRFKEENSKGRLQSEADVVTTLLLLTRMWRVVRIAHGFAEFGNIQKELGHHSAAEGEGHHSAAEGEGHEGKASSAD